MNEISLRIHARLNRCRPLRAVCLLVAFTTASSSQTPSPPITSGPANGQFNLKLNAGAIDNLRRTDDRVDTDYIQAGQRLGDVFLRYLGKDGAWVSCYDAELVRMVAGMFA